MPALSSAELASSYGWAMATLNAIPDLKRIFGRAVAETWTPAKFVAEVRNTGWFRSLPASAREAAVLRTSDPAEYTNRLRAQERRVADMFGQLVGAHPSKVSNLRKMAETTLLLGWTDEQLRANIGAAYDWGVLARRGNLGGMAGQIEEALERTSYDYGVKMSRNWLGQAVHNIFAGKWTPETAVAKLREYSYSAFPHLRAELEGGMTLRQIADPYVQTMARTLEIPDSDIDMFDPTIRKALSFRSPTVAEGKPTTQPLWHFETTLRHDPRWRRTQNAQDKMAATTNSLLQRMGLTA